MSAKSELVGNFANSFGNMVDSAMNLAGTAVSFQANLKQKQDNQEQLTKSNQYRLKTSYQSGLNETLKTLPESIDFDSYKQRIQEFNNSFLSEARESGAYDNSALMWFENTFLPSQRIVNDEVIEGVTNYAINAWVSKEANAYASVLAADPNLTVNQAYNQYGNYYDEIGLGTIENGRNAYGILTPLEFQEAIRGEKATQSFARKASDPETGYLFSKDFDFAQAMKDAMEEAGYKPNLIEEASFMANCNAKLASIETEVKNSVNDFCDQLEGAYNQYLFSDQANSAFFDLSEAYETAKTYPPQYLGKFFDFAAKVNGHNADVQYDVAMSLIDKGVITDSTLAMLDAGYASTHEEKFLKAREGAVTSQILKAAKSNGDGKAENILSYIYTGDVGITVTDEDRFSAAYEFVTSLKNGYDTLSDFSELSTKINAQRIAGNAIPDILSALYDVEISYTEVGENGEPETVTQTEAPNQVTEDQYPANASFVIVPKYNFSFDYTTGTIPLAEKKINQEPAEETPVVPEPQPKPAPEPEPEPTKEQPAPEPEEPEEESEPVIEEEPEEESAEEPEQETVEQAAERIGVNMDAGNIDVTQDFPQVENEDGTVSTMETTTVESDGKEVVVPTIWDGERHTEEEAAEHYEETGENFGQFDTAGDAERYEQVLRDFEEWKARRSSGFTFSPRKKEETVQVASQQPAPASEPEKTTPPDEPAQPETPAREPLPIIPPQTRRALAGDNLTIADIFTVEAKNEMTDQNARAEVGQEVIDDPEAVEEIRDMKLRGAPQEVLNSMARFYERNHMISEKWLDENLGQKSWRTDKKWDLIDDRMRDLTRDLDISQSTIDIVTDSVKDQIVEAFRYSGQTWEEFRPTLTKLLDLISSTEMISTTTNHLMTFNHVAENADSYYQTMMANGKYGDVFKDYASGKFDAIVDHGIIQTVQNMNIISLKDIRNQIAQEMGHSSYDIAIGVDPTGMTKLMIESMTAIVSMHNEAEEFYDHVIERLKEYDIETELLGFTIDKDLGYVFFDSNSVARGYALCIDPELMVYDKEGGISGQWKYVHCRRGSDGKYVLDKSISGDMGAYAQVGSSLFLTTEKKPSEDLLSGAWAAEVQTMYEIGAQQARIAGTAPVVDFSAIARLFQAGKTRKYKKQAAQEEATFVDAYKTAFGLWEY